MNKQHSIALTDKAENFITAFNGTISFIPSQQQQQSFQSAFLEPSRLVRISTFCT